MAIRTNYELFDILSDGSDYSISAKDKDGNTQVLIGANSALKYMMHKYGTRQYTTIRGMAPATHSEAVNDFLFDYRMWLSNREHNIDRMYQALFDYDYSPIENMDRYETENIEATDSTTYGKKNTEGGSDSITYGKKDTLSGSDTFGHGKKETLSGSDSFTENKTDTTDKTGSETHEIEKAGFNAPNSYTNDTRDTLSFSSREDETTTVVADATQYGKVTTNSGTDTTTYGKVDTLSGTDSTTYGKTDTLSGTDSTDHDSDRTLHVHGNIGVTTNTQLIESELELRMKSLAEMLIDNFINDYTFYA